jgi:hypothetical protein
MDLTQYSCEIMLYAGALVLGQITVVMMLNHSRLLVITCRYKDDHLPTTHIPSQSVCCILVVTRKYRNSHLPPVHIIWWSMYCSGSHLEYRQNHLQPVHIPY